MGNPIPLPAQVFVSQYRFGESRHDSCDFVKMNKRYFKAEGLVGGARNDSEVAVWTVQALLPKNQPEDRQAPKFGNLSFISGGPETRAGRAVLQTALTSDPLLFL